MPSCRILPATVLWLCLPVVATAQAERPGFRDLLNPEYLVQRGLQVGIMALRSQFDLVYGAMSVDLRLGRAVISDVSAWPTLDHDPDRQCALSADRLTVRAAPLDRPDLIRVSVQADGLVIAPECLPPEPRMMVQMSGFEDLSIPRTKVDFEYDIARASGDLHLFGKADGVGAVDLTARLSYLALDGRGDTDAPTPVAYLESARLTVENLGGWEALRRMIPPPFSDPATAPATVSGLLTDLLSAANRDASDSPAEGDSGALSTEQQAFVDSLRTALSSFLENPGRMVVEASIPQDVEVFLAFEEYASDIGALFRDLAPVVSVVPRPARAGLPAALVSQALGDGAGDLDAETLFRVGTALLTGDGAPRDMVQGRALLDPLARNGNGAAALALAEALGATDPEAAYRYALLAAADGRTGGATALDRLEARLPLARVLDLQSEVVGDVQHPVEALQRVDLMRDEAMLRLSGIGRVRSYAIAALWAILAKAAGDSEGADILDQIDTRVRLSDDAGRAAWGAAEAAASRLALQAWIGQDLPARFGLVP